MGDNKFQVAPFICLSGTHFLQTSNVDKVESDLQEYSIIFTNSNNEWIESITILCGLERSVCQDILSFNRIFFAKFNPLSYFSKVFAKLLVNLPI